ncbi:terpenoid synthase protein [Rutstroemia sp. NJR-2017a BVV2]|nr:terpenoid synthase protein [Rutstroemia sp. NJR-2017a BVV2]
MELDSEIGSLANDFNRGQTFRSDTIRYVSYCLGLGDQDARGEPTNKIIRSFKVIGDAICDAYTDDPQLAQRQILLEQMLFFMDCSEIEQRVRLSGELPTIGQYWNCRMGTSAVGVTLAVNECV